jgi:branched-subunit amino acid transport protein
VNELLLISGMALVTYSIRVIIFPVSKRVVFPEILERALRYVPPAVLTAIIMPAVLIPQGEQIQVSLDNAQLIGAILAVIVGWFSKNLLLTIISGMLGFWGWQWLWQVG